MKQGEVIKVEVNENNYLPLLVSHKLLIGAGQAVEAVLSESNINALKVAHKQWREIIYNYYPTLKKWNFTTATENNKKTLLIVIVGKK